MQRFNADCDTKHEYDFQICYFRKCWNIRNGILSILDDDFSDQYEYPVGAEDINKIITFLKSLNNNNWERNGYSIWSWDEYKKNVKHSIKNLKMLRKLMKKYNLEVVFIDSY